MVLVVLVPVRVVVGVLQNRRTELFLPITPS